MKKIEIAEDDFKKIILMLKLSKKSMNIDPKDLLLGNLWRVAPKLADKLLRTAGYAIVENKGRISVKPVNTTETPKSVDFQSPRFFEFFPRTLLLTMRMDTILLLTSLQETLFPQTMYINQFGVFLHAFHISFACPKAKLKIELGSLNGIWGSTPTAFSTHCGFGKPLTRENFKYPNITEAVRSSVIEAVDYFYSASVPNSLMKEFKKWEALSDEEKLKTLCQRNSLI